ncbi:hypothetical protein K7432_010216 [Basidiobolus ranarum]|uniref:Cytochrome P450 n=1 Tax=Basidiobolus ranarum TaxID=34480 RepID=A0ABR2VVV9_9FUNG
MSLSGTITQSLSSLPTLEIVLVIVVLVIVHLVVDYQRSKKLYPPGPTPLPILGNILQAGGDLSKTFIKFLDQYGDITQITMPGNRIVCVAEPDLMAGMFTPSSSNRYQRRFPASEGMLKIDANNGTLMNASVEMWKRNRKFFVRALMSTRLLRECARTFTDLVEDLAECWENAGPNTPLDVPTWCTAYTGDATALASMGKRVNAVLHYATTLGFAPKKDTTKLDETANVVGYSKLMDTYIESLTYFSFLPDWVWKYIPSQNRLAKEYFSNVAKMNPWEDSFIEDARSKLKSGEMGPNDSFLTELLSAEETADYDYDNMVKQNFREMFAAGMDTTASALAFLLYELAKYPEVQEKIAQEIADVLGNGFQDPNELNKLTYTTAVINETMRLHPAVPMVARMVSVATEIAGYELPENTHVMGHLAHMHRDERFFSEPNEFRPERFLDAEVMKSLHKHAFSPFGQGTRQCPGIHLAMHMVKVFIVVICPRFTLHLSNPEQKLSYHWNVVNQPAPFGVFAKRREVKSEA